MNGAPAGGGFVQVAAGDEHSVALKVDGSIVDWGSNSSGQLNGTPTDAGFIQISAFGWFSVALKADGTIVDWGQNNLGQLNGTPTGNDFVQVAAGGYHSVALRGNGTIVDWGNNDYGQLNNTPTGSDFVQVSAGWYHSVALKADGSIVAWGNNDYGQLSIPAAASNCVQVSGGGAHNIALTGPSGGWNVMRLHPPGARSSGASSVFFGWEAGVVDGHAGYWTGGDPNSWVDVHPSGYAASYAGKIGGGQIPGYAQVVFDPGNYTYHAGFWNIGSNNWTDLHPTGARMSMAYSSDGNYQAGWADFPGIPYEHAFLWHGSSTSFVDLNPAGALGSGVYGNSPGIQVGYARFVGSVRASIWYGTAASWVDLHPTGAWGSYLVAESAGKQVGSVNFPQGGPPHAALWSGNKTSWVDLHPSGAAYSTAKGIVGNLQVGTAASSGFERAAMWQGTASSYLNLHDLLPADLSGGDSSARGIYQQGLYTHISGSAFNSVLNRNEAVLWLHEGHDFTPPETSLDGNFDGFTNTLMSGSSTISGNLFISVSGSDDVSVAEFEFSLDGGPYVHCGASVFLSSLALGSHTVKFRAVDSGGNADLTPATFSWTVITASAAVLDMQGYVQSLSLSPSLEAHLLQPLNNAWNNLNDGNPSNDIAVKALMNSFKMKVNIALSQGKLTAQQAQELIDQANAVIAAIGP